MVKYCIIFILLDFELSDLLLCNLQGQSCLQSDDFSWIPADWNLWFKSELGNIRYIIKDWHEGLAVQSVLWLIQVLDLGANTEPGAEQSCLWDSCSGGCSPWPLFKNNSPQPPFLPQCLHTGTQNWFTCAESNNQITLKHSDTVYCKDLHRY